MIRLTRSRSPRIAYRSFPQPCLATALPDVAWLTTKKPLCRAFLMCGTGLEPVTPACRLVPAFVPVVSRRLGAHVQAALGSLGKPW